MGREDDDEELEMASILLSDDLVLRRHGGTFHAATIICQVFGDRCSLMQQYRICWQLPNMFQMRIHAPLQVVEDRVEMDQIIAQERISADVSGIDVVQIISQKTRSSTTWCNVSRSNL